jgi:hypothetical protein
MMQKQLKEKDGQALLHAKNPIES